MEHRENSRWKMGACDDSVCQAPEPRASVKESALGKSLEERCRITRLSIRLGASNISPHSRAMSYMSCQALLHRGKRGPHLAPMSRGRDNAVLIKPRMGHNLISDEIVTDPVVSRTQLE